MKLRLLALSALLVLGSGLAAQEKQAAMEQKARELIAKMTVDEKIGMMMNHTPGVERLGILPYDWWGEALHGVARNGIATVFPEPIGLGATFDPTLIRKIGDAVSDEGRAKFEVARSMQNYSQYTGLTYWAPNVNIFRDPRWGRGMETYGEDPFLTGTMGSAYVRGIQGDDPFYLKAAACGKHFAVHSGPEATRHSFDVNPSKKDLYETYLPAFERLVREGHVEIIMGAYNRVYGASASGSHFLLTETLREQWGFNGHIVSDCGAVTDIFSGHHIAADAAEASAISIKAGLNVECGNSFRALKAALERGLVSEADIDRALEPLILTQLKLGILEYDGDCPYYGIPTEVIASEEHASLARRAAVESMVLLKNDGVLPLRKDIQSVFVTGPAAANAFALMGNYYGVAKRYSTYLQGIASRVSFGTNLDFREGFTMVDAKEKNPMNYALSEAAGARYTIIFMGNDGTTEGEEGEAISSATGGDRKDISIPASQLAFFRQMCRQRRPGNKLIVVLTGGSPLDLREVEPYADAIIMAWYPGQEGGEALADLLFGDENFSGRLPVTFPLSTDGLPAFDDYSMRGRTYKYMEGNTLYPFGYGLAYGSVTYGEPKLLTRSPRAGSPVEVEMEITNDGTLTRTEVVEYYLSTPNAGQGAPFSQLVGFERVTLSPGETRTVHVTLTPDAMQEIQEDGQARLLRGSYTLTLGGAAPTARTAELGIAQRQVSFKL